MVAMPPSPTRDEMRQVMADLLEGRKTREEVADWASEWVRQPDPGVEDRVVWKTLVTLSGADLRSAPHEYLHGESDLHAWLDDFESAE